jgi:hypothetical protein
MAVRSGEDGGEQEVKRGAAPMCDTHLPRHEWPLGTVTGAPFMRARSTAPTSRHGVVHENTAYNIGQHSCGMQYITA